MTTCSGSVSLLSLLMLRLELLGLSWEGRIGGRLRSRRRSTDGDSSTGAERRKRTARGCCFADAVDAELRRAGGKRWAGGTEVVVLVVVLDLVELCGAPQGQL